MIQTFKCDKTKKLFTERTVVKSFENFASVAYRKLQMIDAAEELTDLLAPPNNRLEVLKGNRKGQHSIRINKQFRICFTWKDGNAYDIEIVDYH